VGVELLDRLQGLFPKHYRSGSVLLINADCMEVMQHIEDGEVHLSCVDPPYGIGATSMNMGKGRNKQWVIGKSWDDVTPSCSYFDELTRVSERQIVWGGNFFQSLPTTGGWIFWDKMRGKDVSFSDGELAWTSFLSVIKIARIRYDGFIGADEIRIHPTQKPVKLYQWLLDNYAEKGQRILDTHLGSGSSAIAAHYFGCDFVGIELDKDYYEAACKRFEQMTRQEVLF